MRQTTFNFMPIHAADKQRKASRKKGVVVNITHGTITFPRHYIEDKKLDNKYIKFFVDVSKKALGWKILEKEQSLVLLKEYKQIKHNKTGSYIMSIATITKMFNFTDTACVFKELEIKTYSCNYDNFYQGQIHYVELKNPYETKT